MLSYGKGIVYNLFVLCTLISCDFTPRLQKEILVAQDYLINQEIVKAIGKYEEILKTDCPDHLRTKIYFQLGELYSAHLFDNNKAVYYFKKIRASSEDPKWLSWGEERMAEIYFSFLNKNKEAIISYRYLIGFKPKLKSYNFYEYRLGLCYLKTGQKNKAKKLFIKINKSKNHEYHIQSFYNLGYISFNQKNWLQAIEHWSKYIKLEKRRDNVIRVKYLIANAHETMEQLEEAYNIYYSILGEYPNTQVIQNRLNSIYDRRVARKR